MNQHTNQWIYELHRDEIFAFFGMQDFIEHCQELDYPWIEQFLHAHPGQEYLDEGVNQACLLADESMLQYFLNLGGNITHESVNSAIRSRNVEFLRYLLNQYPFDLLDASVLDTLCESGSLEMVILMRQQSERINHAIDFVLYNMLVRDCRINNFEQAHRVVRAMRVYSDDEEVNQYLANALDNMIHDNNLEAIRYLVEEEHTLVDEDHVENARHHARREVREYLVLKFLSI